MQNKVVNPDHYAWWEENCGIRVMDIVKHLDFCLGNVVKYCLRAGHKKEEGYSDKEKEIEDLEKAVVYLQEKIKMLNETV